MIILEHDGNQRLNELSNYPTAPLILAAAHWQNPIAFILILSIKTHLFHHLVEDVFQPKLSTL